MVANNVMESSNSSNKHPFGALFRKGFIKLLGAVTTALGLVFLSQLTSCMPAPYFPGQFPQQYPPHQMPNYPQTPRARGYQAPQQIPEIGARSNLGSGTGMRAKSWGLHLHYRKMLKDRNRYGLIVGTRHDLGFDWSYQGGGGFWRNDPNKLRRLRRDFPNAELYWSVPWYSWLDKELNKIPGEHIMWGEDETGVGFEATRLDHSALHQEIAAVTTQLCRLGIAPMMDYCGADHGQVALMELVKSIAHQHGLRFLANVGDIAPAHIMAIPDVVDLEANIRISDDLHHAKWRTQIKRASPSQQVYLRLWPDNGTDAQAIADAHRGAYWVAQFETSPRSTDEKQRFQLHHPDL